MKVSLSMIALVLTLTACVTRDVELPDNDSGGSDEMRLSPCVCAEIRDYDGRGFLWRS